MIVNTFRSTPWVEILDDVLCDVISGMPLSWGQRQVAQLRVHVFFFGCTTLTHISAATFVNIGKHYNSIHTIWGIKATTLQCTKTQENVHVKHKLRRLTWQQLPIMDEVGE